jgi:hypothetical protein
LSHEAGIIVGVLIVAGIFLFSAWLSRGIRHDPTRSPGTGVPNATQQGTHGDGFGGQS